MELIKEYGSFVILITIIIMMVIVAIVKDKRIEKLKRINVSMANERRNIRYEITAVSKRYDNIVNEKNAIIKSLTTANEGYRKDVENKGNIIRIYETGLDKMKELSYNKLVVMTDDGKIYKNFMYSDKNGAETAVTRNKKPVKVKAMVGLVNKVEHL